MKDIQLVIPMAGLGSRFVDQGYSTPKPLLPIGQFKMIEIIIQNLAPANVGVVIVIANRAVAEAWGLHKLLARYNFDFEIILIDELTDGPASTCNLAQPALDMNSPLVIANSDQYLNTDMGLEYEAWLESGAEGVIWAMEDSSPKWSYVRSDDQMHALEVREKVAISNHATCGVYGYRFARDFFDSYEEMKAANDRTNGELYVAPSFNYLIERGKKVLVRNLGPTSQVMFGLGVPEDYEAFLKTEIASRFS